MCKLLVYHNMIWISTFFEIDALKLSTHTPNTILKTTANIMMNFRKERSIA